MSENNENKILFEIAKRENNAASALEIFEKMRGENLDEDKANALWLLEAFYNEKNFSSYCRCVKILAQLGEELYQIIANCLETDSELPDDFPKNLIEKIAQWKNKETRWFQFKFAKQQSSELKVKWFEIAANNGLGEAQSDLGYCYFDGDGVQKNYNKAFEWFQKAADNGIPMAQYFLGEFYYSEELRRSGNTVPFDEAKAIEWYRKAADQGNRDAFVRYEAIKNKNDPSLRRSKIANLLRRDPTMNVNSIGNWLWRAIWWDLREQERNELVSEIERIRKLQNLEKITFDAFAEKFAQIISAPYSIDRNKQELLIKMPYHRCLSIKLRDPEVCIELKNNPEKIKNIIEAVNVIGNTYCKISNFGNNIKWKNVKPE